MTIHALLSNKQYGLKKVLEKLIAHRLNKDTMRVLAHLEHEISETDMQWIQISYHSYAVEKQPLEYILGHVSFLGYDFMVDRNTLIPRPETEYMITAVVQELRDMRPEIWNKDITNLWSPVSNLHTTLIDVWTGCGVLGLSCILHGAGYLDQVYLTEYYPETLEVARRNLIQKRSEIWDLKSKETNTDLWSPISELLSHAELLHCSLLDHPLLRQEIWGLRSKNTSPDLWSLSSDLHKVIIVANLPYIPEQLFEDNVEDNVKLREPKPAFVWGEDGLDRYRMMLTQIQEIRGQSSEIWQWQHQSLWSPISSLLTLFLEMMTRQVEILAREFSEHFSFEEVATFHMNIRIVKCVYMR
jgi:methylase of polypeptide subunit release factors